MGWILFGETHHNNTALMAQYAPDLGADPFYRWLNTLSLGAADRRSASILLAVGGWPMVLWGIFLRVVVGLHAHLAGELGDAHVGHAAGSRRATIRATAGGSRC